jgi:hypothetical protein
VSGVELLILLRPPPPRFLATFVYRSVADPGCLSRIRIKKFKTVNQNIDFEALGNMIQVVQSGSGS